MEKFKEWYIRYSTKPLVQTQVKNISPQSRQEILSYQDDIHNAILWKNCKMHFF